MGKNQIRQFRIVLLLLRFRGYIIANYATIRKRFFVFFIFFILSTIFWFYRALDDTYADNIVYPLKIINQQKNKILANEPPDKITLRVRGNGYTLLSHKINPPHLELDLNDFSLGSQSIDSLTLYLITRNAKEIFTAELSENNNDPLEILSTSPDTILFSYTKTRSKKVPVKPVFLNRENLFARQFSLNGPIQIDPEFIIIVGPTAIIDTISFVETEHINLISLKDSVTKKVKLNVISGVRLLDDKVRVMIPVDKYTEAQVDVPISSRHVPDSLIIKLFPRSVKIKYKITLSKYEEVVQSDFMPYVDYLDAVSSDPNQKIKVYIDTMPLPRTDVEIYPSSVEFLIEQNHEENWINRGNR